MGIHRIPLQQANYSAHVLMRDIKINKKTSAGNSPSYNPLTAVKEKNPSFSAKNDGLQEWNPAFPLFNI